jgi:hypothetical protein
MADHCIHEADWGAIQTTVDHLAKEIDGNGNPGLSKTVPVLTKSIDDLNQTVGDLRTAVSGLTRFTEGMKGAEIQKGKGFSNTLKIVGTVIAFIAMMLTVIGMNGRTEKRVRDMVDQYGYEMHTRGLNDTIDARVQ